MVEQYVAELDPLDEPIGVERTVALKTDHAALFGRVDRIDDRGSEGLVIVDYKTGRQLLTVDDARTSLALAVYAAGARRVLRRQCRRVELHHLPTGTVVAWEHTDEGLAAPYPAGGLDRGEIVELDDEFRAGVVDERADELYPAQPGPAVRLVRLPALLPLRIRCHQAPRPLGRFRRGLTTRRVSFERQGDGCVDSGLDDPEPTLRVYGETDLYSIERRHRRVCRQLD